MFPALHRRIFHHPGVSWLLILAFLSLTLFPHHYHLHHAPDGPDIPDAAAQAAGTQPHVIDIHHHSDTGSNSHHDDSHTIQPVTDVAQSKSGVQMPWIGFLITCILLLTLFLQAVRLHPQSTGHRLPRSPHFTLPPLRAPPRH